MGRFFTFVGLVLFALTAASQVPGTLSYQGLLTDASGNPLTGSHSVLFSFYTVSTGGTATFTRGPLTVQTYQGLFTVILGNGQGTNNAGIPSLGSAQYYVGVTPDNQTELTPRVMLTAVPYAFTASALDANATINASQINGTLSASAIPSSVSVPVGTIIAYGGSTIPSGWLICDGSEVSRTAYASLYTAISTSWGIGNNSTTFNLPDLRGNFLRGCNSCQNTASANITLKALSTTFYDPDASGRIALYSGATGDKVGSYQGDQFILHNHSITDPGHSHAVSVGDNDNGNMSGVPQNYNITSASTTNSGPIRSTTTASTAISINTNGGNETRPKNASVMYIIKYQ